MLRYGKGLIFMDLILFCGGVVEFCVFMLCDRVVLVEFGYLWWVCEYVLLLLDQVD